MKGRRAETFADGFSRLPDGFDVRPFKSKPVPLASGTRYPPLRRPCLPAPSARNLGPGCGLHSPVLPPHVAFCIFIPSRHIDLDNWNRTLDVFDRGVKMDPLFSRRIKALRVHWSYDDGDIHVVRLVRINKGGKQTEAKVSKEFLSLLGNTIDDSLFYPCRFISIVCTGQSKGTGFSRSTRSRLQTCSVISSSETHAVQFNLSDDSNLRKIKSEDRKAEIQNLLPLA
ncbi:hypothetical protein BJV77DRAFT_402371 [Russula vinacea]|nr:hypothetical protein BJV77DRAFT_402371 [Russula vinacea]